MAGSNGGKGRSNFQLWNNWYGWRLFGPRRPDLSGWTEAKAQEAPFPLVETLTITAAGVASTLGLGSSNLKLKISALGLASTGAFGSAGLKLNVTASGIASTAALGSSNVKLKINATGLTSTAALGTSTLTVQLLLSPTGLASTAALGTSSLELKINATGVASANAFGTSAFTLKLSPSGFASSNAFGTASIELKINATGLASTVAFGPSSIDNKLNATGLPSTVAFGTTTLGLGLSATGLASTNAFGAASIKLHIEATGLTSTLAVGTSTIRIIIPGSTIQATGLPSTLRFGNAGLFVHATVEITSHCDLGKDRLLEQFKDKPKISALICLLADQIQAMEQASADVLAYRSLTSAFGKSLDGIGQNIQLPRHGVDDPIYKRYLTAKTMIIDSRGRPEEILSVLVLLDNGDDLASITIREEYPNCVIATCTVPAGYELRGEFFASLLKQMVPACVRMILEFEERDVDLFEWDESMTGLGWDEVDGGGGIWAEAV